MQIGIIGGGLIGVVLAYELSKTEHSVTLIDQQPTLGGINSGIRLHDGAIIPRFQQMIMPGDHAMLGLADELGVADSVRFNNTHIGFIHAGQVYSMTTLRDFLSFEPLRLLDRLRLGRLIWQVQRTRDWRALDHISAHEWLIRSGGQHAFDTLWEPLLTAKFDGDYRMVPATFIWSWLNRLGRARSGPQMKGVVGALTGGCGTLIGPMTARIQAAGGRILKGVRVREVELRGGALWQVRTSESTLRFDQVIAAVPTPVLAQLVPGADEVYRQQLHEARYLGLICPAVVIKRPLTTYQSLSLTDPTSPFASIIEMPHPTDPAAHIVYLPKYTAPENDWMGVSDEEITEAWLTRLFQLFPGLGHEDIAQIVISRARYLDPVQGLDATQHIIPVQTPYRTLLLANSGQIYPGLPTPDATIRHAQRIARAIIAHAAGSTMQPAA